MTDLCARRDREPPHHALSPKGRAFDRNRCN